MSKQIGFNTRQVRQYSPFPPVPNTPSSWSCSHQVQACQSPLVPDRGLDDDDADEHEHEETGEERGCNKEAAMRVRSMRDQQSRSWTRRTDVDDDDLDDFVQRRRGRGERGRLS